MHDADAAGAALRRSRAWIAQLPSWEQDELARMLAPAKPGSALFVLHLPASRSRLLMANGGLVHASDYHELGGLFRKRVERWNNDETIRGQSLTYRLGRNLCDAVKSQLQAAGYPRNEGFFTSDELPGYGISREECSRLCSQAQPYSYLTLRVFFVYPHEQALATKLALDQLLVALRQSLPQAP